MKKTELTAMTVAELKALARKRKVSLSAGDKKADIIKALIAVTTTVKPAEKRAAAPSKKKVEKVVAQVKKSVAKKAAAAKPAKKKTVKSGKATASKGATKKRPPAGKKLPKVTPVREWKLPPGVEEPLMAQERVAESKYYTGPLPQVSTVVSGELPLGYNEEKISILSRDPYVAYAYWEATSARIEREKSWFGWDSALCVRIYDITGVQFDGRNATGYFDQEVADRIGSWYFDIGRPSHSFCADIGLLSPGGRFLTIARSNYITMPRDGVSDVIDEEWMLVDEEFWKLYGYPEGFRQGISSPEMQEMLRRRRELEMTSPGLFSRDRAKRK
ncbi:MAG: DUF4912 domain-containing protein [Nitrospirota bacterium]